MVPVVAVPELPSRPDLSAVEVSPEGTMLPRPLDDHLLAWLEQAAVYPQTVAAAMRVQRAVGDAALDAERARGAAAQRLALQEAAASRPVVWTHVLLGGALGLVVGALVAGAAAAGAGDGVTVVR